MTTLLIGFVSLVILPALILAEILSKVIKDPAEIADREDTAVFTLSSPQPPPGSDATKKGQPAL